MNETANLSPKTDLCVVALLLGACLVAPLLVGEYRLQFLRDLICFAIFAMALNLIWSQAGLLSFGHATFFGLGTYAVAIGSTALGPLAGPWLGVVAGLAAAALVSALIGYFLLFGGVRGAYFTIVTLALAVIFEQLVLGFPRVTGGNTGIIGSMTLALPGGDGPFFLQGTVYYYVVLAAAVAITGFLYFLKTSRRGLVLNAILDNELRAAALGNNTPAYLLFVFIASAVCAALAGALYASGAGFVAPDTVGLSFSTQVVIWVAIGGRGTLSGPVIGAVLVLALENWLSSVSYQLWPLVLGCLFVGAVFIFPRGIVGLAVSILGSAKNRLSKPARAAQ